MPIIDENQELLIFTWFMEWFREFANKYAIKSIEKSMDQNSIIFEVYEYRPSIFYNLLDHCEFPKINTYYVFFDGFNHFLEYIGEWEIKISVSLQENKYGGTLSYVLKTFSFLSKYKPESDYYYNLRDRIYYLFQEGMTSINNK